MRRDDVEDSRWLDSGLEEDNCSLSQAEDESR
jgi:hypothetical protein